MALMRFAALLTVLFFQNAWAYQCEVWRDSNRIAHARTQNDEEFYYCFGYLHGRDRGWEMDHFRRTLQGKNSEVHGFSHLKGDLLMRLLNLRPWAEKIWKQFPAKEKALIKAYAKGVTAGFKVSSNVEFKDVPRPKKWKGVDTISVMLLQSFDQTRKTFYIEWEEAHAQSLWKAKAERLFNPDGVPWDVTVLKSGEYPVYKAQPPKTTSVVRRVGSFIDEFPYMLGNQSGSNNWVMTPQRIAGNYSMLANDPHLDLKTPMMFYWVNIESPEVNLIGATVPGIPVVVSGTNSHVSWGLTNSYLNTADALLMEEGDGSRFKKIRPLVWVKWWFLKLPFFFKSFTQSQEGYPVLPLEKDDKRPMVLRWSGFYLKADELAALFELPKVKSVEEMDEKLSRVGLSSWNFVFTDKKGNIGHRVIGKAFKTQGRHPHGLRTGSWKEFESPSFLTSDQMPHVLNPKRGWVATANNRHWPKDSEFYPGRSYQPGFRAKRIEELLEKVPKHDKESFRSIQCDQFAVDGPYLAPLILKAMQGEAMDKDQRRWLDELYVWDFQTKPDCKVCAIYRRTLDIAMEQLRVFETGFWRLGHEGDKRWKKSTADAFKVAYAELKGKKWGEVHINPFPHLSNREDWVMAKELPTGGDKNTVNPGTANWNKEKARYEHFSGASQRLIVEMKSTPVLWLILPGLNADYNDPKGDDPWKDWASCELKQVEWPVNWAGKSTEKLSF